MRTNKIPNLTVVFADDFGMRDEAIVRSLEISCIRTGTDDLRQEAFWKDFPAERMVLLRTKTLNLNLFQTISSHIDPRDIELLGSSSFVFLMYQEERKYSIFSGSYPKTISCDIDADLELISKRISATMDYFPIFMRSELGSMVGHEGLHGSLIFSADTKNIENYRLNLKKHLPNSQKIIFKHFDKDISDSDEQNRFIFFRGKLICSSATKDSKTTLATTRFALRMARLLENKSYDASFSVDIVYTIEEQFKIVELKPLYGASFPDAFKFYSSIAI